MDYTAIFVLACIFIPLEKLLPLHPEQRTLRRDWLNDLIYVLVNGFVVRAGFTLVAGALMLGIAYIAGPNPIRWTGALPIWAQVTLAIILADSGYYTAHRICHTVPALWKFHAVHHSVEEMDWLATHRVHPVDQIFSNTLSMLPIWVMGFSLEALAIHQMIYQAHALLLHSNLRIKFGPLKWLVASPEYHHWHHANERDAYDRNFAAQLSIIDVIAGTIFLPIKRRPKSYGLNEPMPRNYPMQLIHPFRSLARSLMQAAPSNRLETRMSATEKTRASEDNLGKLAMLLAFGYFGYQQVLSLISVVVNRDSIPLWELAICSLIGGTAFLGFVLYYTITRLPPRESATGVTSRIVAIVGTFIMSLLIVIPPQAISAETRIISSVMVTIGSMVSIYCLRQLGRSFSIMATSRALKTQGAYNTVRHPLYAAEVLMIFGVVLGHGTALAFGLGAIWLVLQVRRAQYEEAVLRQTFPEYADYAARVPMLIPGLRLGWLEASVARKPENI
ncbi:MAG: Sterol desaturase/sphingolipid hydroxylase, fatty acid hydroxylase superfamily [Cypionkella sp.]|uniref:sterol desaturase family protein n=1 Tax=Cypionkella sp. TaxID=2811411 RepID=UPI00260B54D9|nr:sterol desaturase family protein [Cypionkella sp.]MDB5661339.1 Sterol desaturase/sphingolipid hydroxylase, fatty acid hydroxylase superfamily [Cypionkella sp.]